MFGMGTGVTPPPWPPGNLKTFRILMLNFGLTTCEPSVNKLMTTEYEVLKYDQASRSISISRLNASLHLHH